MDTPTQSDPTTTTTSNPFKSFADMVDYQKMYAELEQRGIFLTDEEKKKCEEVCGDRLRNHDGGQVIGNSFGATLQGWVYDLFAFIKNLFSTGTTDGDLTSGISNIASNIGSTVSSTAEQGKLFQLQLAETETYDLLKAQGGNLAKAAEDITGMKPYHDDSPNQVLQASILNQVGKSINLPVGTNTSLDPLPVTVNDATPTAGLPPRLLTQPLTQR